MKKKSYLASLVGKLIFRPELPDNHVRGSRPLSPIWSKGENGRRHAYMSAQSEFVRVPVHLDYDYDKRIIFVAELTTTCPLLGAYTYDTDGSMSGNEVIFSNLGTRLTIAVPMPLQTACVAIRNATSSAVINDLRILNVSLKQFEEVIQAPLDMEEISTRSPWVFIHSFGKTGTVTLKSSLRKFQHILVDRDHFVNLPSFYLSEHSRSENIIGRELNCINFLRKAEVYKNLYLRRERQLPHFVLAGVRQIEDCIVSMVFQYDGETYVREGLGVEETLQRVEDKLPYWSKSLEDWWKHEFFYLYGLSLHDLRTKLSLESNVRFLPEDVCGSKIVLYRIEDGDPALRDCLRIVTGDLGAEVVRGNLSEMKVYSQLYQDVKNRIDFAAWKRERSPFLQELFSIFYDD